MLRIGPAFLVLVILLFGLGACGGEHLSELMKASRDGNLAAVKRALDGGADVNYANEKGKTALMFAASNGHTDTVKLLLDHGAQIDQQDNFGTTAVIVAATTDTAALLARRGADPTHKDTSGGSALSNATFFGHADTVKALLKYADHLSKKDADELMMIACGLGHLDVTKALFDHGVDINARGIKERTAIMAAAAFNKVKVTQWLLEHGADAKLKDADGFDAFDIANENNSTQALKVLTDFYAAKKTSQAK
jgi:ankyrin repeat protein